MPIDIDTPPVTVTFAIHTPTVTVRIDIDTPPVTVPIAIHTPTVTVPIDIHTPPLNTFRSAYIPSSPLSSHELEIDLPLSPTYHELPASPNFNLSTPLTPARSPAQSPTRPVTPIRPVTPTRPVNPTRPVTPIRPVTPPSVQSLVPYPSSPQYSSSAHSVSSCDPSSPSYTEESSDELVIDISVEQVEQVTHF